MLCFSGFELNSRWVPLIKEFVERAKFYMQSDQFHVVEHHLFWIQESKSSEK